MMRQKIISHRGLSGHEPENSLKAFSATVGRGIKAIEFDVHRTSDGVIVVNHDFDIAELSIADNDFVKLKSKKSNLCALAEILESIPPKCLLDVEIKAFGIEDDVLRELSKARNPRDYIISSFDDRTIARVKAIDQTVQAGLLLGKYKPTRPVRTRLSELFPTSRLRACNADFVAPYWKLMKFAFIRRMARKGYPVFVWTVNNDKLMESLVRNDGIAGLITDRPIDAMRIMNKLNK